VLGEGTMKKIQWKELIIGFIVGFIAGEFVSKQKLFLK